MKSTNYTLDLTAWAPMTKRMDFSSSSLNRYLASCKKKSYNDPKEERLILFLLTLRKKANKSIVVCGYVFFAYFMHGVFFPFALFCESPREFLGIVTFEYHYCFIIPYALVVELMFNL